MNYRFPKAIIFFPLKISTRKINPSTISTIADRKILATVYLITAA